MLQKEKGRIINTLHQSFFLQNTQLKLTVIGLAPVQKFILLGLNCLLGEVQ